MREGEVVCNTLIGFNFGDGHLHNEDLIEAVQDEAQFEPGELIVVWVESQPIHRRIQHYKVIDPALGVIERGTWNVEDAVREQPWLPNGPIPLNVTWTRPVTPPATGRARWREHPDLHDDGTASADQQGVEDQRQERGWWLVEHRRYRDRLRR